MKMMLTKKLPKNYIRESLEDEVDRQLLTSLDKAWVVLHYNRLMRDLGAQ